MVLLEEKHSICSVSSMLMCIRPDIIFCLKISASTWSKPMFNRALIYATFVLHWESVVWNKVSAVYSFSIKQGFISDVSFIYITEEICDCNDIFASLKMEMWRNLSPPSLFNGSIYSSFNLQLLSRNGIDLTNSTRE